MTTAVTSTRSKTQNTGAGRQYLLCRAWVGFANNFPFDDFNTLPDEEINSALEGYARQWPREHRTDMKKKFREHRERKKTVLKQLAKRRGQIIDGTSGFRKVGMTERARASRSALVPEAIRVNCKDSRGVQIARLAGWALVPGHEFGELSPSKTMLFAEADAEIAEAVFRATTDHLKEPKFSELGLRFWMVAEQDLNLAERTALRLQRDRVRHAESTDNAGKLHHYIVGEAKLALQDIEEQRLRERATVQGESRAVDPAESRDGGQTGTKDSDSLASDSRLDAIPELNTENGEWVIAVALAKELQTNTSALGTARNNGLKCPLKPRGIDPKGRMWHKHPKNGQIWYLRSSLPSNANP